MINAKRYVITKVISSQMRKMPFRNSMYIVFRIPIRLLIHWAIFSLKKEFSN